MKLLILRMLGHHAFYVVEFVTEKTVDYIPEVWMKELTKCFWPKNNVKKRRRNCEKPFTEVYSLYENRVLSTAGKFWDYEFSSISQSFSTKRRKRASKGKIV